MFNIGFISIDNPRDRNSFSGTTHYMYNSLCKLPETQVTIVADAFHAKTDFVAKILYKLSRLTKGKIKFDNKLRSRKIQQAINATQKDLDLSKDKHHVLIAPVASDLLAKLKNIESLPPIIFITDATYPFIRDMYKLTFDSDHAQNEEISFEKSALVLFSSEYMVNRATSEFPRIFKSNCAKLNYLPFGLNMDSISDNINKNLDPEIIELLFVGKDWERKGGPIALQTVKALNDQGRNAKLTIIGCNPSDALGIANVEVIPFLNKNLPEQQQRYFELLMSCHFLLLPTKADCTPMVIAEANAFGAPALTTNVGGIPTLVTNQRNGFLFTVDDNGSAYANAIISLFDTPEAYAKMSKLSRQEYENRLNWDAWANSLVAMARNLI